MRRFFAALRAGDSFLASFGDGAHTAAAVGCRSFTEAVERRYLSQQPQALTQDLEVSLLIWGNRFSLPSSLFCRLDGRVSFVFPQFPLEIAYFMNTLCYFCKH